MSDGCYVVTGASSGIGAEVARRLIARGETVVLVGRRAEALRELGRDNPKVSVAVADLEQEEALSAVAAAVKATGLAVRGFVHAAGFNSLAPLSLVNAETAQRLYALHALFPMRFLGWMGKVANHVEGAACVLVSSLVCHLGEPANAAYAAAKGAVEGMLKSTAAELAPRGIRVNAVAPGVVDTPMAHSTWMDRSTPEQVAAQRALYPFGFGTPAQVADVIDFFLSPAASWITGQTLVVDGGHSLSSSLNLNNPTIQQSNNSNNQTIKQSNNPSSPIPHPSSLS